MSKVKDMDKVKLGKYSKSKGKRGEREVANLLKARGYKARRGQQFKGTSDSPDVICEDLPFNIEVKYTERPNFKRYMEQSVSDCGEGQVPIVIHKYIRGEWHVMLKFKDFMDVVDQVYLRKDEVEDEVEDKDKVVLNEVGLVVEVEISEANGVDLL